jgi:hypothetical protein
MLFHRMWGTPDRHCRLDCSALRVSRPFLLHDQRESRPAVGEICEECQAILLEDALDGLLELESRIAQTRAKLKNSESHPICEEAVREHMNVLKTSLQVMDECHALLFNLREKGEP